MVNYKNGKIYTIRSNQTEDFYVGSTTDELRKRLWGHTNNYRRFKKGFSNYVTSHEIIKYGDAYIELYEKFPCNDKMELQKREGEIIRKLDCVNKYIPCRSSKEWYYDNKEINLKKMNIYRAKNKDKLLKQKKEYYYNNRDKILKQKREYHSSNQFKLSRQKHKENYICECGKTIQRCEKARHNKSKYHRMNVHNILNHL